MTTDAPLLLARDGAVATIRFNRPAALNAIDPPMARAFLAAVREIAADRTVRAVLLSGSGKGFMAGGDLAVLSADPQGGAAELIGPLHEALTLLDTLDDVQRTSLDPYATLRSAYRQQRAREIANTRAGVPAAPQGLGTGLGSTTSEGGQP